MYPWQKPSADGCNWPDDLGINAGIGDLENVRERLRPLLSEARRRFNLRDDS